ncbi:MAG: hypothetical protein K1X65_20345 [Caldilineales bacterium]|nr:hypothetical protein [Caldilineales bacterium]MCW5856941.1 hypothetical protein [Caldilineales bacterium]
MSATNLSIPTELAEPRCFVLQPIINEPQAWSQAGAYKGKVFGRDWGAMLPGRRDRTRIEEKLLHRRLVPFWHIRCTSHFDFSRLNEYEINALNPDATTITLIGQGQQLDFRVDQTGRSMPRISVSGFERCVTNREFEEYIDSYIRLESATTPQIKQQIQRRLDGYTKQKPVQVLDLEAFAKRLEVDGRPLFDDELETLVVPPLEGADTVVKRAMKEVMVSIDAQTIHEWGLRAETVDLYFRPLFVFEFEKYDERNNPLDRRLEELDALDRNHWTNLATTEFQMSSMPWGKILKLSSDIGIILLQDVPVLGRSLEIGKAIAEQGPGIVDDLRGR